MRTSCFRVNGQVSVRMAMLCREDIDSIALIPIPIPIAMIRIVHYPLSDRRLGVLHNWHTVPLRRKIRFYICLRCHLRTAWYAFSSNGLSGRSQAQARPGLRGGPLVPLLGRRTERAWRKQYPKGPKSCRGKPSNTSQLNSCPQLSREELSLSLPEQLQLEQRHLSSVRTHALSPTCLPPRSSPRTQPRVCCCHRL